MKNTQRFFVLALMSVATLFQNCTPEDVETGCSESGTLVVSNKSDDTVHKILIDNTNYGTLDPGETKEFTLPTGKYELEFRGISGTGGCTPSQVTIRDCDRTGYSCSN